MKKLFIYYSHTGNGDIVAEHLQKQGIEIRKVMRKKKLPKSFFFCMMTGGFLAGTNHKDKLVDFDPDISSYDEVIIGSPIWNARFSSPINAVLSQVNFDGKKLSFLFYSGSGEGPKALERIQKEHPEAKAIFLKEPTKHPEELKKLDALFA